MYILEFDTIFTHPHARLPGLDDADYVFILTWQLSR